MIPYLKIQKEDFRFIVKQPSIKYHDNSMSKYSFFNIGAGTMKIPLQKKIILYPTSQHIQKLSQNGLKT